MSTPVQAPAPDVRREAPGGVGESARRPDATPKVTGQFAYGSDLWMDGMIWGVTLRSPHPHARIRSIAIGEALATGGVYAVLTHDDVPGQNVCGLELADQPVLAEGVVRYEGEPVALVAADHPEIARQAAKKIAVEYEVLTPVTDARQALDPAAPRLHPDGNLVRHLKLRKGDPDPAAEVVVEGTYRVGMQDQAFLGPEAGLAVPDGVGGVDLYVATQWLHVDQRQICAALGLPPDQVRLVLAGVGGAFGGREDLSVHVHACMLALHTGKPVKMVYNRAESFYGHVHRHPATMRYEHGARRDGTLVYVRAEIYLDGGAYTSSTPAVVGNAGTMGIGPYDGAERARRLLRPVHQQPAVRRHARLRVGAGRVRLRGADGQAGAGAGPGPGRGALPQRDQHGRRGADRAGRGQPGAGGRTAAPAGGDAAARPGAATATGGPTCAGCPAGWPTPPTARASCAAWATRSATRTSGSPRGTTTTPRPGSGWRSPGESRW